MHKKTSSTAVLTSQAVLQQDVVDSYVVGCFTAVVLHFNDELKRLPNFAYFLRKLVPAGKAKYRLQ